MIMTTPATIDWDISGLPAAVQTWLVTLNSDLKTGWQPETYSKMLTYQWAALGGYTVAKRDAIRRVIEVYRRHGWNVTEGARSNQTQFSILFELP